MSDTKHDKLKAMVDDVVQALPAAVVAEEDSYGDLVLVVERKRSHEVLKALKEAGFNLLLDVIGVDLLKMEHKERFEVVYLLYSLDEDLRLRVKVPVPEDDMNVPSATDLWESANWGEREAYDMFGFNFEGHPNLARILCHREFVGHALRKDYPVMKGQWATTTADLMPDLDKE
jgi:NADH/F420H2 dehydrogenase subunit C